MQEGPLAESDAVRVAGLLRALADPTRLRLLSYITSQGCDQVPASELSEKLGVTQPTVSHHMAKLVEAGLLVRQQDGKRARYTVVRQAFQDVQRLLELG